MKRFVLALVALLTMTVSASAMSYSQARDQALFLTDKMAYELNLTDEQYEAAYEINLDYLMRIDDYDDLYGIYWRQRNLDLSYILLDWQYQNYCAASYFYRPLYWSDGFWHFGIYARYPHRDYFFFGCPDFVVTYRGGHSWYYNGGRSWYYGRRWAGPRNHGPHIGMRGRWDRGNYGGGYRYNSGRRTWTAANRNYGNGSGTRSFGNLRRGGTNDSPLRRGTRTYGSQSNNGTMNSRSRTFTPSSNGNRSFGNRTFGNHSVQQSTRGTRSFGTPRQSSTRSTVNNARSRNFGSGSFGNHSASPRSTFTPSTSNRSYSAPRRSYSAPSRSYSAPTRSYSTPSRSYGGGSFGNHSSSGSFGGGHSSAGASHNSGGGHFGRR